MIHIYRDYIVAQDGRKIIIEFYTYAYLVQQGDLSSLVKYAFIGITLIILLGVGIKAASSKFDSKYRDLTIILLLFVIFGIGTQIEDYSRSIDDQQNSSRAVAFINKIADNMGVDRKSVAMNSMRLRNGMIIRLDNVYYEVSFTNNMEAYALRRVKMLNDDIVIRDASL